MDGDTHPDPVVKQPYKKFPQSVSVASVFAASVHSFSLHALVAVAAVVFQHGFVPFVPLNVAQVY